jgi:hypothetical protein
VVVPQRGERTPHLRAARRCLVLLGPLLIGLAVDGWADLTSLAWVHDLAGALTKIGVAYPPPELARVALTAADARAL